MGCQEPGLPEGRAASWTPGSHRGPAPLPSAAPEVAWQLRWRAVRTEAMGQSGSPGRTIAATGTARSLPFPPGSGDLRPAGSWDSQGLPLPRARQSQHATAASELLGPRAPAVSLGSQQEAGDLQTQGAGRHGGEVGHRVRVQQRPHTVPGKRSSTEDRQRVQV